MFSLLISPLKSYLLYKPISISNLNYKQIVSLPYIKEFNIQLNDKESINGFISINNSSDKFIIYSHGNAGNIYTKYSYLQYFKSLCNYNIVFYDYRGFGKSIGTTNESNIYQDILNIWKHLVFNLDVNPKNIILYGESLGCCPSLWLSNYLQNLNIKEKLVSPPKIILHSGFASLKKISNQLVPGLGTCFISTKEFNNLHYIHTIEQVPISILIIHSKDDELIPYNHALELIEQNKTHSTLLSILGTHNQPLFTKHDLKKIKEFLL